jgi:hypothetical protein
VGVKYQYMGLHPFDMSLVLLGTAGCCGCLLMFVGDLVLYLPADPASRTAHVYFRTIDPNGVNLKESPMQDISDQRLMLGGVLGPVAAMLYALGFSSVYWGLGPVQGAVGPFIAAFGLSMSMVIGSVYHALFVYTGLLAKALRTNGPLTPLRALLAQHQRYILYVYWWAAVPALVGSAAFAWSCLSRETIYPAASVALAPCFSAPIKVLLKRHSIGGLVLCGGLTNLWNLLFMVTLTVSAWSQEEIR